jgi:2-amino-4-hydroxy-6-hydroxymethyldihydropteridine diphosphokinase
MAEVFLSLGSNVNREMHIPKALEELAELFGPLIVSSIYESEAVGFEGEPFFNLAVKFHSDLPATDIARLLREIEFAHGRSQESRKFEPRALDIDLLIYGNQALEKGGLRLPRDDIVKYAFMLEPLAEIDPKFIHPDLGQNFAQLWGAFDKSKAKQNRVNLTKT